MLRNTTAIPEVKVVDAQRLVEPRCNTKYTTSLETRLLLLYTAGGVRLFDTFWSFRMTGLSIQHILVLSHDGFVYSTLHSAPFA